MPNTKHYAIIRGKWLFANCSDLTQMRKACNSMQEDLMRFYSKGVRLDPDRSSPEDDYISLVLEDCTVEEAELLFGDYLLEPEEEV